MRSTHHARAALLVLLLVSLVVGTWARAQDPGAPVAAPAGTEAAAPPVVAEPSSRATYTLSAAQSDLYVIVYNDPSRVSPVVSGHDHAIEASRFDGTVTWDPNDPAACKVSISVPVSGLVIDPPGLREKARLDPEGTIDDGTKPTVIGNMSGKKNLNASANPTITFESTRCDGSQGTVPVTGVMTIAGVSKTITVPMTVQADGARFSAKGRYEFGHADYGMTPFTYGPFTPKNAEGLVIVIDVKGSAGG